MAAQQEEAFPWHIGLHDAHCHPTDINASLQAVPQMDTKQITIMASRVSDQSLVSEAASKYRDRVIPAFGHHPWFTHLVYDELVFPQAETDRFQHLNHFQQVLQPQLEPEEEEIWLKGAGNLISLRELLHRQRKHLEAHPRALIGEVGLDKAFRIPEPWLDSEEANRTAIRTQGSREGRRLAKQRVSMAQQAKVLEAQLRLAGEMGRAVSVHGVQAHGVLFDLFQNLWKGHSRPSARQQRKNENKTTQTTAEQDLQDGTAKPDNQFPEASKPFPPTICLHSYSGSIDTLKQYLQPKVPSKCYASFSIAVNFNMPGSPASKRAEQVIRWIPQDRLLIESDLHQAGPEMDDMMEQIARKVCELRNWSLELGVSILAENYKQFIGL